MNNICEVFARITHAPQVFIYSKSKASKNLKVSCQFGFPATELSADWHMKALDGNSSEAISYADTEQSAELQSHPMLRAVPKIRSLLAFNIARESADEFSFLMIANPQAAVFTDSNLMTALLQMAKLTKEKFSHPAKVHGPRPYAFRKAVVDEVAIPKREDDQVAAAFLLKTLGAGQRLLARNGVSYVGLRSWREQVKEHQIAALVALKANLPESFVTTVATEIATAAVSQFGLGVIRNVVPVPCGSSGRADCFSVRIAERVADVLRCEFRNVLKSKVPKGSSHPKASARLGAMTMEGELAGATLVVDDVVTSGKHLELAMKCLRGNSISCFAMAWIAN
jgi:hypothetical protein